MPSPAHNIALQCDPFGHAKELCCHILTCIHISSSTSGLTQHMCSGKQEFSQQPDSTTTSIFSLILPKTPFSSHVPFLNTPFSYNPSHFASKNYLGDIQPLLSDSEDSDIDEPAKSSSFSSSTTTSLSSSLASLSSGLHSTTSQPPSQAHEDEQMELQDNIHVDYISSPVLHEFPMFSPSPSAPSGSPDFLHHTDLDGSEMDINISTPYSHSNDDKRETVFDSSIGYQHLMEEDDIDEEGVPVTHIYHHYLNDMHSINI